MQRPLCRQLENYGPGRRKVRFARRRRRYYNIGEMRTGQLDAINDVAGISVGHAHDLEALTGFRPSTPIEVGVQRFVRWYRSYY